MEGSCCVRRAESSNSFSYALPNPKRLCSNTKAEKEKIKRLFIPEEVVEEILLRLPAESLIMCKHVCKSWCNLINNPSFVNRHLVRVTNKSRSFVLKWIRQELSLDYIFARNRCYSRLDYAEDLSNHELSLVTVCDDEDDDDDGGGGGSGDYLPCVVKQVTLPPFPVLDDHVDFPNNLSAFHCNGIIHMCDRLHEEVAFLLNPVLGEFKLLRTPDPSLDFSRMSYSHPHFTGSGFGYDPRADVYKYVKIYVSAASMNPIALVYTMGTHSSWRVIKVDVEGDYCSLLTKGVYCKGAYYWWNVARVGEMILSFDMSEEKFRSIPIPDHLRQGMTKKTKQLEVWKESICFFFSLESSWSSSTFEMWLMVEGSTGWTKYLTIGPLVRITYPLAFWKDDELLMEGHDGRIVSYNIYTKKLRRVPLPGAVLPGFSFAFLSLNSLVSV